MPRSPKRPSQAEVARRFMAGESVEEIAVATCRATRCPRLLSDLMTNLYACSGHKRDVETALRRAFERNRPDLVRSGRAVRSGRK